MYSTSREIQNISAYDPHDHYIENIAESIESTNDNFPLTENHTLEDGKFPKQRHILGIMGFLGFANVYAMRVNLSVAIVAMVNQSALPVENETILDVCPLPEITNSTLPPQEGDFIWDERTQGIVLGAFFYGYVLTQIPGGRLAELFGGKLIYGFGIFITAVFTLLTPLAAYYNLSTLVLIRVLEGMSEGVTYPAMHAMLARWIPPLERSKFAALVYSGSNVGTVLSLPLSGWLCSLKYMGGWPLAFYIFGFTGFIWFLLWCYFVYDSPKKHPRITSQERKFIEYSLQPEPDTLYDPDEIESIPWKSMLTCIPLWAILITQCGQAFAFYTQLTELPTYMKEILHMDIQQNAILSSLPYLGSWLFGIGCSIVADWFLVKGFITQVNSFKLWNTLGAAGPSIGLICVAWLGCDWILVIIMLVGFGAFQGAIYPGNQMNHISLSPRFAGTMFGFTNAAANTCGFIAPYIIGSIIRGNETLTTWRFVFYLAAGVNVAGNFIYLLFASADEQPWSKQRPLN